MLQKKITIVNKLGLHARAAAKFVTEATHFSSEIKIKHNNQEVNGKSILGVMMLAATQGTEIELLVNGDDEVAALAALEHLINNHFNEAR